VAGWTLCAMATCSANVTRTTCMHTLRVRQCECVCQLFGTVLSLPLARALAVSCARGSSEALPNMRLAPSLHLLPFSSTYSFPLTDSPTRPLTPHTHSLSLVRAPNFSCAVDGGQRAVIFDKFRGVLPDVKGEGTHFRIPFVQVRPTTVPCPCSG
jgi:hypothetical protein